MLYTEWTNFSAVKLNTELEAGALRNVFRLAEGLPQPARAQLEDETRAYADAVVKDDWAMLSRGQLPELSRRTRLLQADSRLPGIFWCVLLVGGILTVASVAMFGSRNRHLHAFQVFSLTLLITLAMLAIADLDRPFAGWVHIDNYPFQRARDNMDEAL
jgi:hypothetical protein